MNREEVNKRKLAVPKPALKGFENEIGLNANIGVEQQEISSALNNRVEGWSFAQNSLK
jgi:hypothetical protein